MCVNTNASYLVAMTHTAYGLWAREVIGTGSTIFEVSSLFYVHNATSVYFTVCKGLNVVF